MTTLTSPADPPSEEDKESRRRNSRGEEERDVKEGMLNDNISSTKQVGNPPQPRSKSNKGIKKDGRKKKMQKKEKKKSEKIRALGGASLGRSSSSTERYPFRHTCGTVQLTMLKIMATATTAAPTTTARAHITVTIKGGSGL